MKETPADTTAFRLPGAVVRRTFVLHTAAIVGVLIAFHVVTKQESLAVLGGATALATLVLALGYASTARRVWLTLSPTGLSSVSYAGRKSELSWSTPITIFASRRSGYKGHTVAAQGGGFLRSSGSAIFIPAAVASDPEFARKVAAWAPVAHPLRALIEHAA